MQSWRRNRRRILALAAAGAAGAATAYTVYKWWWCAEEGDEEGSSGGGPGTAAASEASGSGSGRRAAEDSGVLVDPRGTAGAAQLDAEAHLQHHFDSIQGIADSTTLPSLLPALSRALMQAADVETPLERLRRAKEGSAPLSAADKLGAWEELKVAAFSRALGAAWLLPLLDLFVRVQLNILGRHLYLESAVEGSGMQRPQRVPKLSAPSQERFLSYAEFLAQQGAAQLLGMLRHTARAQLAGVELAEVFSAAQLGQLLRGIAVAAALQLPAAGEGGSGAGGGRGWAAFLLPPPEELREGLAPRLPDNRAVMLGAEAVLVDAAVVEQLAAEAAAVAGGPEFAAALQACIDEVLNAECARLSASTGGEAVPLAKAVPLVAALGADVLSPALRPQLARLEAVRSLSARVYGCCYCSPGGGHADA